MSGIPRLSPIDTGAAPKQYGSGRHCGCGAFLSKYNPGLECRKCECARREMERVAAGRPLIRPMRSTPWNP